MQRVHLEAVGRRFPAIGLVACVASLALLWLVALPLFSRRTAVRDHLEWLDRRGIDANALYYTELEVLAPLWHGEPASAKSAGTGERDAPSP